VKPFVNQVGCNKDAVPAAHADKRKQTMMRILKGLGTALLGTMAYIMIGMALASLNGG
jgi:hypothetical protein